MHVLNILWVVFGIGLMLVLNLKFKINSMVALLVAALSVGMLAGMDLMSLLHTMKAGFGNTLGELAIIVVFGAVIGKLMVDTGIGDTIGMLMSHGNISPYIMAWLITVLIRLATGQGVVSAMTAAGIISAAILDPATGQLVGVNPALLVLATAAGSNTLTHINDASFWLFKGYFDLSVKDTLKTWGLLELVNSVVGLIMVLIISMVA